MELSKYQKDIIDFFENHPHDNILVEALAGTGKSFLICLLTEKTKTSDIYVAFNSSIAKEFQAKIKNPKTKVSTLHSLGFSIMNTNLNESSNSGSRSVGIGVSRGSGSAKAQLDNFKIHKIVDDMISKSYGRYVDFEKRIFIKDSYVSLYNLCRLRCVNMNETWQVHQVIHNYNLFTDYSGNDFVSPDVSTIVTWLKEIDRKSKADFESNHTIDFTDMLYITHEKLKTGEWKVPYWNLYTNIYVDECMPGNVYVETDEGSKKLSTLYAMYEKGKPLPLAKSFNHETNNFEYKPILNVKKHQNRDVYLIKTEGLNKISATENHRFYTQRGYVAVEDLKVGEDWLILDKPYNQKAKFVLNSDQLQLVLASFIGDGHLTKMSDYNTYRLAFTQGDRQYNYFRFKKEMMGCSFERKIKSGYTQKENINQTSSKVFMLPDAPWNLMKTIDERFLAIWFQDDGSTYYFNYATGRDVNSLTIACNNLTKEQCEYLSDIIYEKIHIRFIISKSKGYYGLRLNKEDSLAFLKIIAPFMNESCAYKNPYFNKNNLYKWNKDFLPYGANIITSIEFKNNEDVYDIEVEDNHNFICKSSENAQTTGILSHNCQDLSPLQFNLIKYIKRKGGRYALVGDFRQSIYNFAGADAKSFKTIEKLFSPLTKFELPINYRCPSSHLEKVNKEFNIPIQPRPNAPKGTIKTIEKKDIKKYIKPGDMVISRKNKWFSDVVITLATSGIPIYIEDKEMVESLLKTIKDSKTTTLGGLKIKLEKIISDASKSLEKIAQTQTNSNEDETQKVQDFSLTNSRIDNINFILDILKSYQKEFPNASVINFSNYVSKILNIIPNKDCVRICSVHKAKGLEAENVFVLNEAKVCTDFRNSIEQQEQEKNLSYISITRAKNTLYLVKEPDA